MKKAIQITIGLVFACVIIIASCKKEDTSVTNLTKSPTGQQRSLSAADAPCGTPTVVALIAGQNMNAGTVTVSNDGSNLTVTYATTNGWSIDEMHLYVGKCDQMPTNGPGNPVPGHFPYSATVSGTTTGYSFTIPLSGLDSCFCVAAHAVVHSSQGGTQTAWGAGTRFVQKGNWGTYFSACKQPCYEGCVISPDRLFQGEPTWPTGASVTVGGYTYAPSTANLIYSASASDNRSAFIVIATIKVSGSVMANATVWADATTIENWLSTLGPLSPGSQFVAPANVEAAIGNVQKWELSHICQ